MALLETICALRRLPELSKHIVLKETWSQQCKMMSVALKIGSAVTST
jgi:hypothetical protein